MKTSIRMILSAAGLAIAPALASAQLQDQGQAQQQQPAAEPVQAKSVSRSIFSFVAPPEAARPLPQANSFTAAMVDFNAVKHLNVGDTVDLSLAPGVSEVAYITAVTRRGEDKLTLTGSLVGREHSEVVLVMQVDALAGDITSPHDNMHYKLRFHGGGVHLICDIADDKYLPCAGSDNPPVLPPFDPVPDDDDGMEIPPQDGDPTEGACNAPTTVFDGMIAYSDDSRVAAGGTNAIIAECYNAEARTNLSYSNSGVAARYRLIWLGEVSYAESGNSSTDLGRLYDPADGFLDSLKTTKDSINADFLTLWVDSLDACGRGYCTSNDASAVQVVAWSCAAGNLSHPHEIGHNQGCDHDPANGDPGGNCAWDTYGYGHRWFGNDGFQYRSVMAYDPGTRVPHFSNPNVTYQGVATGTASRDNHRIINNRRGTCEGFQLTRFDIWVQIGYAGVELGTFSLPYNSLSEGVTNIQIPDAQASEPPNLYCKSGTTTYTGTISKQMTIRACGGAFNIGGTP